MWAFAKAMEAANSVDDPAKIREHMQDGLENLPDHVKIYNVGGIGEDGGFESEIIVAAIEDGKVVPIPAE